MKAASFKRKALLGVLLLAVLAGGGWLLLRPAPAPPPVILHPSPRQVADTQDRLTRLDQAASKPGTSPRTLRVSESDLNVALAASKPLHKLLASHGVHAVQVVLQEPDSIVVHASVTVSGQTRNVQIDGTLAPDPKTGLRFTASGAQMGSLPVPAALVTSQANALAARFSRQFLSRFSLSVQGVYVQKKELVIIGVPLAPASPPTASPARH